MLATVCIIYWLSTSCYDIGQQVISEGGSTLKYSIVLNRIYNYGDERQQRIAWCTMENMGQSFGTCWFCNSI